MSDDKSERVALRHLTTCLDGRRIPLNAEQRAEIQGPVPYWGANGVVDYVNKHLFDETLVLLGEDGAPFFERGRDVAFLVDRPVWVNNHIHVLRPRGVDPRFLTYSLNVVDYARYITGSTRDKLTQDDLRRIEIRLPDLQEQRRIADFLDAETQRMSLIYQGRQKQLALVRERYDAWLVRTLLPSDAPSSWQATRIKHLFEFERNGIWGDEASGGGEDVLCVRVADFDRLALRVKSGASTLRSVPRAQYVSRVLRNGDVLLEKSGGGENSPVGFAVSYQGSTPAVCSNFVSVLRPDRHHDPRYLALLMASLYKARRNNPFIKQTTGIQNLDSAGYLSQAVRIPVGREQAALAQKLDEGLVAAQKTLAALRRQQELLQERKHAVISAAVNGGVDISTARGAEA
ncbi:restriction endonuclease subunit S [Micromonospora sp. RTP1Z1]|uniref:restriction endonuclease subunit S n=1 Tax=Micromonospora sp. RTP1Z1 TaxID=2994043 RepID=UPI0029C6C777|nr:restriction endonuclease subunit S [Micromonospora sp. RTP1Z1]